MIKEAIIKIVNKEDLSYDEAYTVMNEIMNGETSATQNAAFLAALSTKSSRAETIDEIAGCAEAMRSHALKCDTTGLEVTEIVGTGGDGAVHSGAGDLRPGGHLQRGDPAQAGGTGGADAQGACAPGGEGGEGTEEGAAEKGSRSHRPELEAHPHPQGTGAVGKGRAG